MWRRVATAIAVGFLAAACGSGRSLVPAGPHAVAHSAPRATGLIGASHSVKLKGFHVLDLSFVDDIHGFALGGFTPASITAILRTSDGGRRWKTMASTPRPEAHIQFSTPRLGWAYGPDLYVTTDGGQTWNPEHPGGRVGRLAVAGPSVWALVARCPNGVTCRLGRLRISEDAGRRWHTAPLPPAIHPDFVVDMQRRGTAGWILTSDYVVGEERSELVQTHDGGATWSEVDSPCMRKARAFGHSIGPFIFEEHLSPIDSSRVWLLCLTEPALGQNDGNLFLSIDGGMRWRSSRVSPAGADLLLATVSLRAAWIADNSAAYELRRFSTLRETHGPVVATNRPPWIGLQFVDPRHGWAAAGDRIYRTTDGRRWLPVSLHPSGCG
jgi:hypothetical protein